MHDGTRELIRILGDAGFHRWEYTAHASYITDAKASAIFHVQFLDKVAERQDDLFARGLRVYIRYEENGTPRSTPVFASVQLLKSNAPAEMEAAI